MCCGISSVSAAPLGTRRYTPGSLYVLVLALRSYPEEEQKEREIAVGATRGPGISQRTTNSDTDEIHRKN